MERLPTVVCHAQSHLVESTTIDDGGLHKNFNKWNMISHLHLSSQNNSIRHFVRSGLVKAKLWTRASKIAPCATAPPKVSLAGDNGGKLLRFFLFSTYVIIVFVSLFLTLLDYFTILIFNIFLSKIAFRC
jgi:hypothetical protein